MRRMFKLGIITLRIYIPGVLEVMPNEFDSHAFIAVFMLQNQQAYIDALRKVYWDKEPLQTINNVIINLLEDSGLVQQIGTRESENMFKQVYLTEVWRKV